ncbi:MAG: response regulator [Phycisphaerae bacterium]|nr:response regulator [Phycisphaerae bacterium]
MMESPKPLRVLIVEDVEADVLLLVRELRKNGFDPDYRRIETSQDMREALREPWDLILSDFTLPRFNGVEALKILKAHELDIPFIVVSGTIGENVAVSMMREGAHDYFLKGRLSRLAPAIERELREAKERHARREAEKQRDRLFNLALDMFCVAGFDGYFKQLNPAWEQALGWNIEELLSKPFIEWVHPEDVASTEHALQQLLEGQIVKNFRNRYRCKDDSYRWISWNSFPLMKERSVFAVARDVTEQKSLEDQLRQSQKMEAVGQLAGGVAHDFNNQLTVISGYTELLMHGLTDGDPTHSPLEAIRQACQRARSLTEQLLAFSRKQMLRPEVLNLNTVLTSMNDPLNRMVSERVDVAVITDGALRNVKVDRRQFEQAIFNMVINARDAMPAGGKVTLETANVRVENGDARLALDLTAGPYVIVIVRDTGEGMLPEVREQIFEPFFTTKEQGKGTGLGLSMVYGFIRQSGGAIRVESRPGRGTQFTLYFPATDEPAEIIGKPAAPPPHAGDETILVVEDDESVRQWIVRVLREAGYTVLETANAREAMPLGREYAGRIDLMIADVIMPGMTGPELAEHLLPIRNDMRVLFISGYTQVAALDGAMMPEDAAFLGKPFSHDELLQEIRILLDASVKTIEP